MALALSCEGETKIINSLCGNEEIKRHLQNLGFIKGQEVQVLSKNSSGMILLVRGVRIALNRGLAQKIIVN